MILSSHAAFMAWQSGDRSNFCAPFRWSFDWLGLAILGPLRCFGKSPEIDWLSGSLLIKKSSTICSDAFYIWRFPEIVIPLNPLNLMEFSHINHPFSESPFSGTPPKHIQPTHSSNTNMLVSIATTLLLHLISNDEKHVPEHFCRALKQVKDLKPSSSDRSSKDIAVCNSWCLARGPYCERNSGALPWTNSSSRCQLVDVRVGIDPLLWEFNLLFAGMYLYVYTHEIYIYTIYIYTYLHM